MKKRKLKVKNIILLIIIIIFSICLIISLIDIIKWMISNDKTNKQIEIIKEIIKEENNNIISNNVIENRNIDFNKLKEINNEVVGWIKINNTNIDYPYVLTTNNNFYLNHSFDKSYNDAGWVFLDYRNNLNLDNKNNILYAHSRLDKTMFGSLSNIFKKEWLNDPNNYYIEITNELEKSIWKIFSIYVIDTTSDYLQIDFNTENDFIEFSNMLINRSSYNFNTNINKEDKILTLSTCYNDEKKIVVHAVKINN